jgi:membrane protein DedA with SNARE-associated domain
MSGHGADYGGWREVGIDRSVPYLLVFVGSLGVDLIPIMAPPAWMVMAFCIVKFQLNPWIALSVGVPASALGRYLFSLYIPKFSARVLARRKKEELSYVGKKLKARLWQTWVFVLGYTLSPLSTTALFTAAGMSKVPVWHLLPPFVVGKFVSDAMMVKAGEFASGGLKDMMHGVLSAKNVIITAVTLVVTAAFMFIDWHALLVKKTFHFNFDVFKG